MVTATISGVNAQGRIPRPGSVVNRDLVATVGPLKITADEFVKSYDFGPAFPKKKKNSKEIYLKYLINEKLLALDGYKRSLDTTRQFKETYRAFHNDLITEELFKDEILSKVMPSPGSIDSVIAQKQLNIEIRWLYLKSREEALNSFTLIKKGEPFDSLFQKQLGPGVNRDDRELKNDCYHLKERNPLLSKILDTLKIGNVSLPVHVEDGWYIVQMVNMERNLITTESEMNKLRTEAVEAVRQKEMDRLSDLYVRDIMDNADPVISKEGFSILRSYIANYLLAKEKYESWKLAERMDTVLDKTGIRDKNNIEGVVLVDFKAGKPVTLSDFLSWFWVRDEYIKLNEKDLTFYSISLQQCIWRMVRDHLLVNEADKRNISARGSVIIQEQWWRDKILYGMVKNEITNAVLLQNKESGSLKDKEGVKEAEEDLEFTKKMLHTVNRLKQQYGIKINSDILNKVKVSDENDPRAIEVYIVKKGGTIPRTPYPTIDNYWNSWE
jgi:hypothetical protein